jgi:hypothetical protein
MNVNFCTTYPKQYLTYIKLTSAKLVIMCIIFVIESSVSQLGYDKAIAALACQTAHARLNASSSEDDTTVQTAQSFAVMNSGGNSTANVRVCTRESNNAFALGSCKHFTKQAQ